MSTEPEQSAATAAVDHPALPGRPLRVGVTLAVVGLIIVFAGLTTDAVLHARDAGLAAEEGIFTITNPGHALLGAGLGLTALGVGLAAFDLVSAALAAGRLNRWVLRFGMVGVVAVIGVAVLASASGDHDHGTIAATTEMSDGSVVSSASAGAVDRSRLPADQAAALTALSWSRPGSIDGVGQGHVHSQDSGSDARLTGDEAIRLESQIERARSAIASFDTIAEAEAAGYVQAGTSVAGVGAHYLKWTLVDQPFDPAAPSMLLFETIGAGTEPKLVGYSYWMSSTEEPEGFAGSGDTWHQHYGLCFVNGWLRSENQLDRTECAGDWINGSDLWMLHAWVVPDFPNADGIFADVNMAICPRRTSVPDVMSCDVYQS